MDGERLFESATDRQANVSADHSQSDLISLNNALNEPAKARQRNMIDPSAHTSTSMTQKSPWYPHRSKHNIIVQARSYPTSTPIGRDQGIALGPRHTTCQRPARVDSPTSASGPWFPVVIDRRPNTFHEKVCRPCKYSV